MHAAWKKWLIVIGVLVATHLASAAYYYEAFASGTVREGPAGALTLELKTDEWIRIAFARDPTTYLRAAENVAAGQGMTIRVPGSNPPRIEPFYYWGPGAPFVYGWWLRLFGDGTMRPLFGFAVLSQLASGAIAVATAALWTRSTAALVLTAFFTGCCPPLQNWFYSSNLPSSELVGLLPLSAMTYVLSKAFIAFRAAEAPTWRSASSRPVWLWFAAAGLLIGLHSLVRDSGNVFALFVAAFLVGRAMLVDRRRMALAGAAALVMMTATQAVRFPVERWNQARIGHPIVSSSGAVAIWRYSLWVAPNRQGIHEIIAARIDDPSAAAIDWFERDLYESCIAAGFGFGQSLDPRAAERVESHYRAGRPSAALFSLGQFIQAVICRPAEAIAFKAKRLPVLWLGAGMWPDGAFGFAALWCVGAYGLLIVYIVVQRRRRRRIPEPLYLYFALIVCAMPLIHFEFRYTFPVWNGLVLAPGLLLSTLRNQDRHSAVTDIATAPFDSSSAAHGSTAVLRASGRQ